LPLTILLPVLTGLLVARLNPYSNLLFEKRVLALMGGKGLLVRKQEGNLQLLLDGIGSDSF
jgi:hypothetical protein